MVLREIVKALANQDAVSVNPFLVAASEKWPR
jgi:hypothetical protein